MNYVHPQSGNMEYVSRGQTEDLAWSKPRKMEAPDWWYQPVEGIENQPVAQKEKLKVPNPKNQKDQRDQKSPKTQSPPSQDEQQASPASPSPAESTSSNTEQPPHASTCEAQEELTLQDLVPPEFRSLLLRVQDDQETMRSLKELCETFGVHYYEFEPERKEAAQQNYRSYCMQYLWSGVMLRAIKQARPHWSIGKQVGLAQRLLAMRALCDTFTGESNV